ncbi:MAG: hypothetical protein JOZ46_08395 [Candidatus Dormibacteraeota bacterium]|nr:hypothetical protein [Candidatus Dormibacteraeota bacterium]MBV9525815.1 hypothetical protein [Candidatus Dormibacteraeota bacterium]
MRVYGIAALLCACAALAGCSGNSSPSSSASPRASASPAGTEGASPAPSAATNAAATVNLSVADIPESGFSQVSDGPLAGHPQTDQRTFASADGSVIIEADVIVESAQSAIAGDYSQARTAAHGRVAAVSSSGKPSIGEQADEYAGTTSTGKGLVAITFVRSLTVDAVLVETAGAADTALAEQLATALDARVQSYS